FPGTTQLELSTGAFLWIQATSPLFVSSSTPCLMHTACIDPTTVHGAYTGKTIAATHTFQSQKIGGAGGIRTHEWRFCRPLPWATWVPRRITKYSKFACTLRASPSSAASTKVYFFSATVGILASRKNRADSSGGVGLI